MLKVFISFSGTDQALVGYLEAVTDAVAGVEIHRFDHDPQPGAQLADKVKAAIRMAHVVVVLLTRTARGSAWVQQEIGIAEQAGKLVVPIVEKGVDAPGILEGRECLELDPADPVAAFQGTAEYLARLDADMRANAKRATDRKAAIAGLTLLVGSIIAIGAASDD
jgi:hypothetical protein